MSRQRFGPEAGARLGGEYAPLELSVLKEAFVNNESLQEGFSTATAPLVIAELSGNHNQSLERALDS